MRKDNTSTNWVFLSRVHCGSAYNLAPDTAIGSYAQMSSAKLVCYAWVQENFKDAAILLIG